MAEFTEEQRELQRKFMEATRPAPVVLPKGPSVPGGLQPGLYYDISAEVYHADPCPEPSLSASIAQTITSRSEFHAHAKHPRFGGKAKEPSKDMDRGTLVHAMLLGKGRDIVVVEASDWRTKKAQEERDAARATGKLAALPKELELCGEAVASFRTQLEDRGIVLCGQSEVVAIWLEKADDGTPVWCRGMFDHVIIAESGDIFDVKTSGKPTPPGKLTGKVEGEGGDIQACAYESGLAALCPQLIGRTSFTWIFCEMDPAEPYAICTAEPDGTMRESGTLQWRNAVNKWARCLRTGEWPGYPKAKVRVHASSWKLGAAMEAAMNDSDEGEAA